MPTTPNGYRYPDPTELVKDGAAAIQNLATDVDVMAARQASGTVSVVINGVNSANATVTFPASRFAVAPVCQVTATGSAAWIGGISTVSATQLVLSVKSQSGANGGASPLITHWFARLAG